MAPRSPEDILATATRDIVKPTLKDGTEQYRKRGSMMEADADFDAMMLRNTQSRGPGVRIGVLSDGTEIVVRARSVPTLEINRPGMPGAAIRYG